MNPFEECPCAARNEVKIVISGLYNGVLLYRCGICKQLRHRHRVGSRERYIADDWLAQNSLTAREVN